jgi:hypothetical protein
LAAEKLDPSKEYKYYITDHKKLRTLRQNRYLRFIYNHIGNHIGWTDDDVHDYCKQKFNLKVKQLGNDIVSFAGSTTTFDTREMTNYIEKIRQWSLHEFDHYVPEANEIPEEILIDIISKE